MAFAEAMQLQLSVNKKNQSFTQNLTLYRELGGKERFQSRQFRWYCCFCCKVIILKFWGYHFFLPLWCHHFQSEWLFSVNLIKHWFHQLFSYANVGKVEKVKKTYILKIVWNQRFSTTVFQIFQYYPINHKRQGYNLWKLLALLKLMKSST